MVTHRIVNPSIVGSTPTLPAIAIVGAGLAGATLAHMLGGRGYDVTVFDQRTHVAGNAHTERDPDTGVMLHKYGPHIFHTDNEDVWKFARQFATFMPYIQRTKGLFNGAVYSLPINLHTINQFFGKQFTPAQAEHHVQSLVDWDHNAVPANFEELALATIGRELYCAFLRDYTIKQWGMHPTLLPASILKRLPLRFTYEDNAFFHKFQGIPKAGYTAMVWNMLDMSSVTTQLGTKFKPADVSRFGHVFYSGPIDEWFDYSLGRLPYRTLDFEVIRVLRPDYQGCAVINSCDLSTPWTRSSEHSHFTPWESHGSTVVYREFSRQAQEGDTPYYPIRFAKDKLQLSEYQELAAKEDKVSFIGRLGTYQYLDMDATIAASLNIAKDFHRAQLHAL